MKRSAADERLYRVVVLGGVSLCGAVPRAALAQPIDGPLPPDKPIRIGQPPPPPVYDRVRLDAGLVGPFFGVVAQQGGDVLGGAGARASFSVWLRGDGDHENIWFDGDVFGLFVGDSTARLVFAGTTADVRFRPRKMWSVGIGFAGGYVFDLTEEQQRGYLRESPFLGPVLIPTVLELQPWRLEFRLPFLFSETREAGVRAIRLGLFAPMFTITVGGAVRKNERRNLAVAPSESEEL